MSGIEDARKRRNTASDHLKNWYYAGAIREAGKCVELSLKALLDILNVDYTVERYGKRVILHDVSNKISEAFEKRKQYLDKEYEVESAREDLAVSMVIHKLLSGIKDYVEYPIKDLEI